MASSRPIGPTCSPVFAFKPMCSGSMARISASRLADGLFIGEQLGPLGRNTMQSMLPICQPSVRHVVAGGAEHFGRVAAAVGRDRYRETSGRCRPVRRRRAAHRSPRASRASPSLCPTACHSHGMSIPPNRSGPPERKSMRVVSDAHARGMSARSDSMPFCPRPSFNRPRIIPHRQTANNASVGRSTGCHVHASAGILAATTERGPPRAPCPRLRGHIGGRDGAWPSITATTERGLPLTRHPVGWSWARGTI